MPSKDDGLERGGHKPELQCPVCFDVLGKSGGPATLPCGHSGCLECLASVQQLNAQCPLCRAPFKDAVLSVNRVLREVVEYDAFTNGHSVDEDGWETMPSSKATYRQFAKDQQQTHPRDRADAMQLALRQPSAPPLRITLDQMMEGGGAIMEAEPPRWLPDSCAPHCGICNQPFRALWRTRHHCRLCGGIFCHQCCHKRMLLPPRFHTRAPERVCQMCSSMLEPLQPFLASAQSRASMAPIHDVTDWSSIRSWVNLPVTVSLEDDIYKATNILRSFCKASLLDKEKSIPQNLLSSAAGFAVLSVLRLGAGWSWTAGTGAVVARREEGGWTPPSAIGCFGFGWGLQAGGELIDLLLVLPTYEAVQAFCSSGHVGVGGHVSLAAGPFGRQAEAALRMGSCGRMVCYNYSMSKGVFLGMALEGSLMYARTSLNHDFYGQPLSSQALLLENSLPPPAAARTLYEALDALVKQYHTLPASRLHSVGGLLTAGSGASSREDAAPPAQHGAGAIAAGESGTGRQARRRSSNKTIV